MCVHTQTRGRTNCIKTTRTRMNSAHARLFPMADNHGAGLYSGQASQMQFRLGNTEHEIAHSQTYTHTRTWTQKPTGYIMFRCTHGGIITLENEKNIMLTSFHRYARNCAMRFSTRCVRLHRLGRSDKARAHSYVIAYVYYVVCCMCVLYQFSLRNSLTRSNNNRYTRAGSISVPTPTFRCSYTSLQIIL